VHQPRYAGTRQPLTCADARLTPGMFGVTDRMQIQAALDTLDNAGVSVADDLNDRSAFERRLAVNLYGTSDKAAALSLTQSLRALLAGKGVSVYAVLPGPIDTHVVRHLELPKTPPEDVARAMLHGVERGDAGIFPDSVSQLLAEGWRVGVAKTLEHPERAAGNGRGDRGLSEETAPMRATMTTHAIVSRDEWQAAGAPA
jgi:hypothetical protein